MRQPLNHPDEILDFALALLEARGGDFWMLARGDSMLPLIREGDRLQVQPLKSPPQPGEILVLRREGDVIAHRLLRLSRNPQSETACLTQGDHALSPDPSIPIVQLIGRIVAIRRAEQELRLDTPTWRRVGGAVSALQLAFLGIRGGTRLGSWLRRGIRVGIGFTLKACQALSI